MLSTVVRRVAKPASIRSAVAKTTQRKMSSEPVVVVPLITDSLEWTLSSPPPLHQFLEPPLFIETDHLTLSPGAEVEEILKAQGEEVSEVLGLENWEAKDASEFEGKIPQNAEWTEFISVDKK